MEEAGASTTRRPSHTPSLDQTMLTHLAGRGPRRSAASCQTNLEVVFGEALGAGVISAAGAATCVPGDPNASQEARMDPAAAGSLEIPPTPPPLSPLLCAISDTDQGSFPPENSEE